MTNLAHLVRKFEALDLRSENKRIEALRAEIGEIDNAIEAADNQIFEIETQIANASSGRAVAEALLAQRSHGDTGPGESELRDQRQKLEAGIAELRRRRSGLTSDADRITHTARSKVRETAAEAASLIASEARTAAETIIGAYAGVVALAEALNLTETDRHKLQKAAQGLAGFDRLLGSRSNAEVPPSIAEALSLLETKGPALPMQFRRAVKI